MQFHWILRNIPLSGIKSWLYLKHTSDEKASKAAQFENQGGWEIPKLGALMLTVKFIDSITTTWWSTWMKAKMMHKLSYQGNSNN